MRWSLGLPHSEVKNLLSPFTSPSHPLHILHPKDWSLPPQTPQNVRSSFLQTPPDSSKYSPPDRSSPPSAPAARNTWPRRRRRWPRTSPLAAEKTPTVFVAAARSVGFSDHSGCLIDDINRKGASNIHTLSLVRCFGRCFFFE